MHYTNSILLYHKLKHHPVHCQSDLGLNLLKLLSGISPGASGTTLLKAWQLGHPVVIKVFPVDCPFKYIRGHRRPNNNIRDYGNFEIGTGLMLTEQFILTGLTQNITICYNYTVCNYSYDYDYSKCHKTTIPRQSGYPIVNDNNHPLFKYYEAYNTPLINGPVETPLRDDISRYFMVERCDGDLQGFIEKNDRYIVDILIYVTIMIFHTLLLFDSILGGYSHLDLGLRNILYVIDPYATSNTYNRYLFPDGTEVDIPTTIIIPKIWDFAYVRYQKASDYASYYDYLGSGVPDFIGMDDRDNDVFVYLQDLDHFLRQYHPYDNIFNHLDLESIRRHRTNTDAIYDYFQQNPITESNEDHLIVHRFPK
jgi:hypothetical protein